MSNQYMSQYLNVFLDEAQEQLGLLESNILEMEKGDHSLERLQVLFRAAHTIKGSSRAMGFTAVGDLTHEMENVLDDLRQGLSSVDTRTVNLLLKCLDLLTGMIDAVANEGSVSEQMESDVAVLVSQLNNLRTGTAASVSAQETNAGIPNSADAKSESLTSTGNNATLFTITDYEQTAIDEALASGLSVYQITVIINEECLMKSVRVFMVLGALNPLGTVLIASPKEEQLDAEEFDQTFHLIFATEQPINEIEKCLNSISEIDKITVCVWAKTDNVQQEIAPVKKTKKTEKKKGQTDAVPEAAPAMEKLPEPEKTPKQEKPKTENNIVNQPAQSQPTAGVANHGQTIRVDVARLDNLLNLIGEMVIDRTQIARIGMDLRERYTHDDLVSHLIEATHRIARITSELQDEIMKARMLPIDGVFQRMPRMVRDLAQKTGKEVEFQMTGGETELDRSVLEVLGDPLIHLLRNCVDHGIEVPEKRTVNGKPRNGSVKLAARHEENHIVIEISDDGQGIDPEKIRSIAVTKGIINQATADVMTDRDAIMLIFASGFSTAEVLTDISGRGVGMDIVRSNLERLGGRIQVDSVIGKGTRFTIHLPLTLAIVRALLIQTGNGTCVIPLSSVEELLKLGTSNGEINLHTVSGQAFIVLRGQTVPIANLSDILCGDPLATTAGRIPNNAYIVIVGFGEKRVGLCVDALAGEQEVVIKSLGILLGDIPGLAGATILGDGRVALIIDVAKAVENIHESIGPGGQPRALGREALV